jgi:hypothetical protein
VIKKKDDVIFGVILLFFCAYIFMGKNVIKGSTMGATIIFLAQAQNYLKGLAILLGLLAVVLILRSVDFRQDVKPQVSAVKVSKGAVISFLSLIVYALVIKSLGFIISSLLLISFLHIFYRIQEYQLTVFSLTQILHLLITTAVFAGVSVAGVYLLFGIVLNVALP